MTIYKELKGQVAVVTGAGRHKGLGEAMARRLALEGVKVVITDIGTAVGEHMPESAIGTLNEMNEIVEEIRQAGGEASSFVCNVLNPDLW